MDSNATLRWAEQALGVLVVLLILLDVFLTVLYARIGTGVVADRVAHLTFRAFRLASKPFGRHRGAIVSFCGPVILVAIIGVWASTLMLGAALVIHPALGTSVRVGDGETPTDFVSALEAGGGSISIVGASDLAPHTSAFRLFYLFNSLVGMSIVTLTFTYLMQVYNALQQQNTLGLKIHLLSAESGDAAELLARLGPGGRFDIGYNNVAELAVEMSRVKESNHFYPVLFYFRFAEPFYSVSRFTLVSLDTMTLVESALDEEEYGWLKRSAAVSQLGRGAVMFLTALSDNFFPGEPDPPDERTTERWRRRYSAALPRLREAGIKTVADERAGADAYVSLRSRWDHFIARLAPLMVYPPEEIDLAGHEAGESPAPGVRESRGR